MGSTKVKKCLNIVVYCFLAALIIGGCDIKKKISDVPSLVPKEGRVLYHLNDGRGTAPSDSNTYAVNQEVTAAALPADVTAPSSGGAFAGWNTQNNGGGTHVVAGGTIRMVKEGLILYAIWK